MSRYWVIRTDRNKLSFINDELSSGRLRQGWGWKDELNLSTIRGIDGHQRNADQKACWRRNRRLHHEETDGIKTNDIAILPHLPKVGRWTIVKITDDYRFAIPTSHGDYGHIRPVEVLCENIDPHNEAVSALLRQTMRSQLPMWNIDYLKKEVDRLIETYQKGCNLSEPTPYAANLLAIYDKVADCLAAQLQSQFQSNEFETPVQDLLRLMFGEVRLTRGPKEKGADHIYTTIDSLDLPHRVVVQTKMYERELSDTWPLEQIKTAYESHAPVGAGVIIAGLADSVHDDFEKRRTELEGELGIPIRVLTKRDVVKLFMKYLPDLIEDDEEK